ncbi:MAG TPA: hypothetical protein VFE57_11235, partial [Cyclobacteriaceae bacterium]|nr:hypothetical protein [Cyclobacteriaceae bacterium]
MGTTTMVLHSFGMPNEKSIFGNGLGLIHSIANQLVNANANCLALRTEINPTTISHSMANPFSDAFIS